MGATAHSDTSARSRASNRDPLEVGQHVKVPVLCMLWTHCDINKNMMFGHDNEDGERCQTPRQKASKL